MLVTTKGVIIKQVNYGEADKIFTIFTEKLGKITAFASGVRRHKSHLIASTQLFCYSEFVLYKTKSSYKINSSEAIATFYKIRDDLLKLCYATYFSDLLNEITEEKLPNDDLLKLFLNCLYILNEKDINKNLLKAIFEIRAMCLSGYAPNIEFCSLCENKSENVYFSASEGTIICESCPPDNRYTKIIKGTYLTLCHIVFSKTNKLFSFKASENVINELNFISENYIKIHINKQIKSLQYLKDIIKL